MIDDAVFAGPIARQYCILLLRILLSGVEGSHSFNTGKDEQSAKSMSSWVGSIYPRKTSAKNMLCGDDCHTHQKKR